MRVLGVGALGLGMLALSAWAEDRPLGWDRVQTRANAAAQAISGRVKAEAREQRASQELRYYDRRLVPNPYGVPPAYTGRPNPRLSPYSRYSRYLRDRRY